ncbi:MAG: Wzz/FepE/Etk N-terminal domain-containing protein [Bacteroidales bacterium]|nr:Wzz/FepE/Etk N-terminal domain-containing protein [Bacteroidales bacterium]
MTEEKNFNNNSLDLLVFLYKKRLPIIIITAIGAVASIIISLIITPMYKSTVILYPASSVSVSKALLGNTKGNMMAFGNEEETEQLLQVFQSNEIMNHIVDKFNLQKHYDIDTSSAFSQTKLDDTYNNNISYKKTKFQSVQITVFDKDPKYAAEIANEISLYGDTVLNNLHKERAWNALLIVKYEYKKLNRQIQKMSDSLSVINKMGILDYTQQTTAYTSGLAEGIATGKISETGIKYLENKLKNLEKYGHVSLELSKFIEFEQKRLSYLKGKWVEAGVEYGQNLSNIYIVEKAEPSEKKAKPVRWLIVSLSTLSSFIFAVLFVAFADFFKSFKEKVKNN